MEFTKTGVLLGELERFIPEVLSRLEALEKRDVIWVRPGGIMIDEIVKRLRSDPIFAYDRRSGERRKGTDDRLGFIGRRGGERRK